MSNLPKLKVKWQAREEKTIDLEQAKSLFPLDGPRDTVIVVEGQGVNSYAELVHLASEDNYKDKELLEVMVITPLDGG